MGLTDRIDRSSVNVDDPGPKRRHRLVIDIGADDLEELACALGEIHFRVCEAVEGRELTMVTSGGVTTGWHLEHTFDEDMTHDKYFEAVDAWRARRAEE